MIDNSPVILPVFGNNYGYDTYNPYSTCVIKNRCSGCNQNLASDDPASIYQKQKIIQKTVRVASSLFSMNLAALSTYQKPRNSYNIVDVNGSAYVTSPYVNWNQMSDRKEPHHQVVKSGSGSTYGASSTKSTITRLRPGALSPGGSGVDIKHNSYERYLNRIKGKAPLRRGVISTIPYIPFNRAYPVYGGKIMKTSIVNSCNCPIDEDNKLDEKLLYKSNDYQYKINNVKYEFNIGDYVWAKKYEDALEYEKAQINKIDNETGLITVVFSNGTEVTLNKCEILIYFDCGDCVYPLEPFQDLSNYGIESCILFTQAVLNN